MYQAFEKQVLKLDGAVLLGSRLLLAWLFVHEGVALTSNFGIAAERRARLGAAALGLFCLATAILFHNNFANRIELLHFDKDLAIAGGMFVLMVRGAGAWSIDGLSYARKLAAVTA
jgi:putative oxidoreductase